MSNLIQRNRYFDGEFLRSFDFDDEQAYHVAVRRRLNRSLHLYGIVEGLQLVADVQAGITQISITPGLAIDALGREIFLFAPYTLGDADLSAARLTGNLTVDVWIRYKKTAGTLPSSGYAQCNDPNQFTRWQETCSIVLVPQNTVLFTDPEFVDPDTDDPEQDQVGVFLGSLSVDQTSVTAQFTNPAFGERRVFIGARIQRLRPPLDFTNGGKVAFPILGRHSAISPPTSIGIESNVFAEQNLIVGDDFEINDIVPTPVAPYPPLNSDGYVQGIVKVAGDIFTQGNVYSYSPDKDQFLALSEQAKQFMPDALAPASVLVVAATGSFDSGLSKGIVPFTLSSTRLKKIGSVVPFAFLSAIQFDSASSIGSAGMPQVSIDSISPIAPTSPPSNTFSLTIGWTAGPSVNVGTVSAPIIHCAVIQFRLNLVAICYP